MSPPPPPPTHPTQPDRDEQHLRLISVLFYVLAGITALMACIPFIHLAMGVMMLAAPQVMQNGPNQPGPPPEMVRVFGIVIVVIAGALILAGWAFAGLMLYTGRAIHRRVSLLRCQVLSGVACIAIPFGTALGVFALIVLMRPSVTGKFPPRR